MTFQTSVGRQYTTGFPGDIVRDGPQRGKPGRIANANEGANVNAISRVFGFKADVSLMGTGQTKTLGAQDFEVELGGTNYYGILGNSKRYALYGNSTGPLGASMVLPQYSEGEFYDMCTGLVVEVFNPRTSPQTLNYGDLLAYVPKGISSTDNPNNLPIGAIIAYTGSLPTGMVAIPGGIVIDPTAIALSGPSVQSSTYTIVQLTR